MTGSVDAQVRDAARLRRAAASSRPRPTRRARSALHSALGLMKAAALAPDTVLLPTDFDAYRKYSRLFKAAVARDRAADRGPRHRRDLHRPHRREPPAPTTLRAPERTRRRAARAESDVDAWWRARDVAKALKAAVRDATGLTCSIAVAPNKLLAKIASELDKPDGLTLLRPDDIATRIWPLPPRRINGIGPKASAKLDALGIRTIGELAQADLAWLIEHFGRNYGAWLHDARARPRRPRRRDRERAEVDQPRDDVRARPVRATRDRDGAVADLHRPVRAAGGRPEAQGLRGPHDRRQAALRQFQRRSRATARSTRRRRTRRRSAAPPANA